MKTPQLFLVATLIIAAPAMGGENKEPAASGQAIQVTKIQAAPAAPAAKPAPVKAPSAQVGDPAASLDGLTYVKGGPVSLDDGKILVVEFWATWCGPCISGIPHLTKIQKQFKEKGVTVIGISSEKNLKKVKDFVAKKGEIMDYTVAIDPEGTVNAGYMKAYKQRGIPTAFIVNRKGAVVWVGHPAGELDKVLEQVLAGTFDAKGHAIAQAEREAAQHKFGVMFHEYRTAIESGKSIEETRATAEALIKTAGPSGLNSLLRIMLQPNLDDASRDMESALKAAAKANLDTGGKNPAVLDTYALVLFKTGRLAKAIAAQEKAIALTTNNERILSKMTARLKEMKEALEKDAQP